MLAKTEATEPKVVNGINVDNLLALVEGVRHDAAKGNTQWRVTTALAGPDAQPCARRGLRDWRTRGAARILDRY